MRLDNNNNQILYGRRGTGKTHVLKVLQHDSDSSAPEFSVYIDMRTLGSNSQWEAGDRPGFVRVANLLKDVLGELQTALLEYATRPGGDPPGEVFESLSDLAAAITRSVVVDDKVTEEESASVTHGGKAGIDVDVSVTPKIRLRGEHTDSNAQTLRIVREGRPLERILFREIGDALQRVLADAGIKRLLILIDEWSAVPAELQPLLAEFIKRTCFPYPRITVKIAAVDYRCSFGVPLDRNNTLGFELTADVSSSLELDDFFIYDRDERHTLELFAEVLYRHVAAECDNRDRPASRQYSDRSRGTPTAGWYLRDHFGIRDAEQFVSAVFDDESTLVELTRAGEGVARDFMILFQRASFETIRRHKVRIDVSCVRSVAREWYAQEKITNVDEQQRLVLERIVGQVVGHHKARSFLFDNQFERTEMIMSLIDLRLIHLVKRGVIPEGEQGGRQYNVYTLDYGTYVDALGTDRAPRGDFSRDPGDHDAVVPFHDDRRIKRIIITPDLVC
ncbi:MAG: hypothetical protein QOH12_184 [Solirubrobacteraceae bacterium]|nr:hypothetical protein [Solirubrobacteraceae bacterium]